MKTEVEDRLHELRQRAAAMGRAREPSTASSPGTEILAGLAGQLASNAINSLGLAPIIPRRSASAAARRTVRQGNAQAKRNQREAWLSAQSGSVDQLLSEVETVFKTLSTRSRSLTSRGNSDLLIRKLGRIRNLNSPSAKARALATTLDEVVGLDPIPNEEVPVYLAQRSISNAKMATEIVMSVEIALRSCVKSRLATTGSAWWTEHIPARVRSRADKRRERAEAVYPSVAARESPLSYVNFSDYDDIILEDRNWREHFSSVFPSQGWISTKLGDLEEIRNALMHSNPLTQHGLDKLRVTAKDLLERIQKS